jgi:hypothetical protein
MSTVRHIVRARLRAQLLVGGGLKKPEDVVRWMGAVQAQEYTEAKWALAMRMRRASDAIVERALTSGAILRTHVLRPTWHFVTAADIRWMLALTGPRVSAAMSSYNRRLELDASVFRDSQRAMSAALRGGAQLTRQELKAVLHRARIHADGVQRLAHIVMQAELDGVICSGARRGRQFTYALLDERVPAAPAFSRDHALTELTRRYFTSHGPAQLQDFVWWSGLTAADARAGLEMVASALASEIVDGRRYWFSSSIRAIRSRSHVGVVLPLYDEYLIAYKDRSAVLDPGQWNPLVTREPFMAPIVVDGQVVGGWKRTIKKNRVDISLTPFVRLAAPARRAIADAAYAYAQFFGLDVVLSVDGSSVSARSRSRYKNR